MPTRPEQNITTCKDKFWQSGQPPPDDDDDDGYDADGDLR